MPKLIKKLEHSPDGAAEAAMRTTWRRKPCL